MARPDHLGFERSGPGTVTPETTMRVSILGVLLVFCAAAACASRAAGQEPSSAPNQAVKPAADTTKPKVGEVFTADQLLRTAAANVYDALQQVEPQVLTGRGRGAPDVYVDRVLQLRGLDKLRELSLTAIRDATYLRSDQAQAQKLTDSQSAGGAILVRLR